MIGLLAALQGVAVPNARQERTHCNSGSKGEIVVCATRPAESPYRLPKLPDTYDRKPLRAESDAIPGVHTRAHLESEALPDGRVDKRLLVTFSLPF